MFEKLKQLFAVPDNEQPLAAQHLAELAATALLIEISHADHDIDPAETRAILDIAQQTFALDENEVDKFFARAELKKSAATSLFEFTEIINRHFDKAQKFALIVACWRVAYADGKLDRYEDYTVRKIADLIYVSHGDFIRAKHSAADRKHSAADQKHSAANSEQSAAAQEQSAAAQKHRPANTTEKPARN